MHVSGLLLIGLICLSCLIAVPYIIVMQKKRGAQKRAGVQKRGGRGINNADINHDRLQAEKSTPSSVSPVPPVYTRHASEETDILFDQRKGYVSDNDSTEYISRRRGLRLTWNNNGERFHKDLYEFPAVLGRDRACQVVIDTRGVSRRHAQLIVHNNEFVLQDMDSRNGVYLNGERIRQAVVIQNGCEINLGLIYIKIDYIVE